MSQHPKPASASPAENHANVGAAKAHGGPSMTTTTAPTSTAKLRSCVTCRTRKVRCDKTSPCSHCRRAKIPCVFPSSDRPPRWARRLERVANNAQRAAQDDDSDVSQVMDRLRSLEGIVKELSSQLEHAHAAASASTVGSSPAKRSPGSSNPEQHETWPATNVSLEAQRGFGRLVLGDASEGRYVSSGFWSRVNDELDGLKMETAGLDDGGYESSEDDDVSPDKTPETHELDRTPSERHAFFFRHNLTAPMSDLGEFHPMPSQVPFLLDVYSENVNVMVQVVHISTVKAMARSLRGNDPAPLSPANEALLFAIYYAAVTSMEDEDITANFGSSKSELNLKYRLGLELALAKADFLNSSDMVLVQALAIFLFLVRRHDSPRFVWMMTGIVIRMAQALGLHRDGSHFPHLTPFEVEMRRRVWWSLCMLDIRSSEDQGADLTIAIGSFDTRLPSSINDADIGPETTHAPPPREGVSDMTLSLVWCGLCDVTRQMMGASFKNGAPSLDEQSRLLNEIFERLDRTYLRHSNAAGNIAYWVNIIVARLVAAKMRLIIYLPVLLSSPPDHFSDQVRTKLFVAAIEVAEYNHTLNAERACRHWRWIFQTYTHWHAIVYLLIEMTRRPWSPTVERAWVILHSSWLIPRQSNADKNMHVWVPLRRLMTSAKRHRSSELERLRSDPQAAQWLEAEDKKVPLSSDPGGVPGEDNTEYFRQRWRRLISASVASKDGHEAQIRSHAGGPDVDDDVTGHGLSVMSQQSHGSAHMAANSSQSDAQDSAHSKQLRENVIDNSFLSAQPTATINSPYPQLSESMPRFAGQIDEPWLLGDGDPLGDVFSGMDAEAVDFGMDLDLAGDVDWSTWLESANASNSQAS